MTDIFKIKRPKPTYICVFKCEDKTFYWGPFPTFKAAQEYSKAAKKQAIDYYGKDIAKREIHELTKGVI